MLELIILETKGKHNVKSFSWWDFQAPRPKNQLVKRVYNSDTLQNFRYRLVAKSLVDCNPLSLMCVNDRNPSSQVVLGHIRTNKKC